MGSSPMMFHNQTTLGEGPYATVVRSFSGINPFNAVWFVDTVNGANANGGRTATTAFATLAKALETGVAAAGDTIVIAPGSTIALTAVVTLTLAGLRIVGVGEGAKKPIVTLTPSVACDAFSLEAAGIILQNLHFAAPGTDENTAMVNVAAAGCKLLGLSGIGSQTSKNFVDCITLASGADDVEINGLEIYNTVVAVNSFISIEAAVARPKIFNTFCFGDVVAGGLIDAAKATQIHLFNVVIGVIGTTKPAATLDSNPTGLVENCKFSGTDTTLANNGALGNLVRMFNVWVLEETDGSKQGAQIPAVDAD